MKKFLPSLLLSCLAIFSASVALADYDFGDAPESYGIAKNDKGIWQRLGDVNGIDDGVLWSVDGGSSWDNTSALVIGQTVQFKFLFWQLNEGSHTYDQLLAVIDSNKDGNFDKGSATDWRTGDETLSYQKISTNNSLPPTLTEIIVSYYVDPSLYEDGDTTWLRARVTCWHTPWPFVGPTGLLGQGETEDYQLTFNAVPEPATMLLFGTGLVGFAGIARRRMRS